jgi:aryl-alcohol dehydrogenase-like predicted oxidoreductase
MTELRLVFGSADLLDDDVTPALLDQFVEAGGRALDVANVYGDGSAQQAVGRWLRGRPADVRVYAKGCHPPWCAPSHVRAEVEQARESLGVERLDAFLLHRDDLAVPIESWAEALGSELQREAVASIGVSNWTEERFIALRELLGTSASVFSNHFSLVGMEETPWPGGVAMDPVAAMRLAGQGTVVLAWASLAGGYLVGGERADSRCWASARNEARRARARELACELGVTASAVALAYVLAHEGVRPIVGTRSPGHLAEALRSETFELDAEQVAYLEGEPS